VARGVHVYPSRIDEILVRAFDEFGPGSAWHPLLSTAELRAPATKPICTDIVNQACAEPPNCQSAASATTTAETENQTAMTATRPRIVAAACSACRGGWGLRIPGSAYLLASFSAAPQGTNQGRDRDCGSVPTSVLPQITTILLFCCSEHGDDAITCSLPNAPRSLAS
jgi:hypothetical protein